MNVERLLTLAEGEKKLEQSDEVKLGWICDVEGRVLSEIHAEAPEKLVLPHCLDDELTLPDCYARVYLLYLAAMSEFSSGNYVGYLQLIGKYESELAKYAKYWIRNRKN